MSGRPALLLISLVALNVLVMALDVFLLPKTPLSQHITMPERSSRGRVDGLAPRLEGRIQNLVRSEIQEAVAAQGDHSGLAKLRDHYRRRSAISGELAGLESNQSIAQRRREAGQPRNLLLPFGLFRTGLSGAGLYLASLLAFGSLSLGALFLIPRRIKYMRDTLALGWSDALKVAALGILGYVLSVTLVVLLAATVVGLPIGLLIIMALAPVTIVGLSAVLMLVGRVVSETFGVPSMSPLQDMSVGIFSLFPIGLIPVIGWAVAGAAVILGFGAVLATKMGSAEGWSLEPLKEE